MQRRLVSILSNPFIVCKENFDIQDIHSAYGMGRGEGDYSSTIFANAAMVVGEDRKLVERVPIVVDL